MPNEIKITEGDKNIIIQNAQSGRDIIINKTPEEIVKFLSENNDLQKEYIELLKEIRDGVVEKDLENKKVDKKKLEILEISNIDEVIDKIKNTQEKDLKANRKCLLKELEKIKNKKYKVDEKIYNNFVKNKTEQEFKLKIASKIFKIVSPEYTFSVPINELSKSPLTIAYIKCMLKKRWYYIIGIILAIIITFSIIFISANTGKEYEEIKLSVKVIYPDSSIFYDASTRIELTYDGEPKDFVINPQTGNLIDLPIYTKEKDDTSAMLEVRFLKTGDFKCITKKIKIIPDLQHIIVKRDCNCNTKGFIPNVLVKTTNGDNFTGEITFTGIAGQPEYNVVNGKVDITNNLDCEHFNKNIKINSNYTKDNFEYKLDTSVILNDCGLIELSVDKKYIYRGDENVKYFKVVIEMPDSLSQTRPDRILINNKEVFFNYNAIGITIDKVKKGKANFEIIYKYGRVTADETINQNTSIFNTNLKYLKK